MLAAEREIRRVSGQGDRLSRNPRQRRTVAELATRIDAPARDRPVSTHRARVTLAETDRDERAGRERRDRKALDTERGIDAELTIEVLAPAVQLAIAGDRARAVVAPDNGADLGELRWWCDALVLIGERRAELAIAIVAPALVVPVGDDARVIVACRDLITTGAGDGGGCRGVRGREIAEYAVRTLAEARDRVIRAQGTCEEVARRDADHAVERVGRRPDDHGRIEAELTRVVGAPAPQRSIREHRARVQRASGERGGRARQCNLDRYELRRRRDDTELARATRSPAPYGVGFIDRTCVEVARADRDHRPRHLRDDRRRHDGLQPIRQLTESAVAPTRDRFIGAKRAGKTRTADDRTEPGAITRRIEPIAGKGMVVESETPTRRDQQDRKTPLHAFIVSAIDRARPWWWWLRAGPTQAKRAEGRDDEEDLARDPQASA